MDVSGHSVNEHVSAFSSCTAGSHMPWHQSHTLPATSSLSVSLAILLTLLFRVSAGFLGARLDVPERVYVHARWPMDAPGDRRGMHGRAVRDRSMSEVVAWTNDSLSTRLPASEN